MNEEQEPTKLSKQKIPKTRKKRVNQPKIVLDDVLYTD